MLPQLREPSLKRDTHSGKYYEPVAQRKAHTHAADHALLMARQNERRLARLGRAMGGDRTINRRRARPAGRAR